MNQISEQYTMRYINGFVALILIAVIFIMGLGWALSSGNFSLGVIFVPVVLLATRFRIVQPNTALVSTLFWALCRYDRSARLLLDHSFLYSTKSLATYRQLCDPYA